MFCTSFSLMRTSIFHKNTPGAATAMIIACGVSPVIFLILKAAFISPFANGGVICHASEGCVCAGSRPNSDTFLLFFFFSFYQKSPLHAPVRRRDAVEVINVLVSLNACVRERKTYMWPTNLQFCLNEYKSHPPKTPN